MMSLQAADGGRRSRPDLRWKLCSSQAPSWTTCRSGSGEVRRDASHILDNIPEVIVWARRHHAQDEFDVGWWWTAPENKGRAYFFGIRCSRVLHDVAEEQSLSRCLSLTAIFLCRDLSQKKLSEGLIIELGCFLSCAAEKHEQGRGRPPRHSERFRKRIPTGSAAGQLLLCMPRSKTSGHMRCSTCPCPDTSRQQHQSRLFHWASCRFSDVLHLPLTFHLELLGSPRPWSDALSARSSSRLSNGHAL